MTTAPVMTVDDAVVAELEAIMNEPGSVLTGVSSRANRARVPRPSRCTGGRAHAGRRGVAANCSRCRRSSSWPTAPRSSSSARRRDRPQRRSGPLRGGIMVDVKRMNQIHEIDLADRTVTVGPASTC